MNNLREKIRNKQFGERKNGKVEDKNSITNQIAAIEHRIRTRLAKDAFPALHEDQIIY